jgi:hypothetical protein
LQAEASRRLDDYVPSAQEWAEVEHWLRSARIKLDATRTAGDAVRLGLIVSLNLHEVLRWLFLVNLRPMSPQGSVLTHLRSLDRMPPDFPGLLDRMATGTPLERADSMSQLLDWLEPRLATLPTVSPG